MRFGGMTTVFIDDASGMGKPMVDALAKEGALIAR
jgi:hypothetical protein